MIIWFTGQPGAGKTTLAERLRQDMEGTGRKTVHLEGEWLRWFTQNDDWSANGRRYNVGRMQELARHLAGQGVHVIVSMVSPFHDQREVFKAKGGCLEVYVHTSEERGKEKFKCHEYEPPTEAFIDIDTTGKVISASVAELWDKVLPYLVTERALKGQ